MKYYFTRDHDGRPILFHTAPGADEIHVPPGDNEQDFVHLIPKDEMAETQYRRNFINDFIGDSPGKVAKTVLAVIAALWFVFGYARDARDAMENAKKIPAIIIQQNALQMQMDVDTSTLGDYRRVVRPMTYRMNSVLRRKFPREPEFNSGANAWGAIGDRSE